MLLVSGLSGPVEAHREEGGHFKKSIGVSCSPLEAHMAATKNIMKMKHTIVMHEVSDSKSSCKDNESYTHF